jgi:hypothetical protein
VTAVLVALALGFLLGVLLMVVLVSGREEEERVKRAERREGEAAGRRT